VKKQMVSVDTPIRSPERHLAFVTDDGYVRPLVTALYSIRKHSKHDWKINIVSTSLSPRNCSLIKECCRLNRFDVSFYYERPDWITSVKTQQNYSPLVYLRLTLPRILSGVDKCIYLDPDVYVRDDMDYLWQFPLEKHALAAVKDVQAEFLEEIKQQVGLPKEHIYFNAGILVMDLDKLRAMDFEKTSIRFALEHPEKIVLQEQDILNHLYYHETTYFPLRWNLTLVWLPNSITGSNQWHNLQDYYNNDEKLAALEKPAIVHFANVIKPWHASSQAIKHPFYEEYLRYDKEAHSLLGIGHKSVPEKPDLCVVVPFGNSVDFMSPFMRSLSQQTCRRFEVILADCAGEVLARKITGDYQQWDQRFRLLPSIFSSKRKAVRAAVRHASAPNFVMLEPDLGWLRADFLSDLLREQLEGTAVVACKGKFSWFVFGYLQCRLSSLADLVAKYWRVVGACPEPSVIYRCWALVF
jgi:lipopolysaccharide biosynthesis glycosyltransferase